MEEKTEHIAADEAEIVSPESPDIDTDGEFIEQPAKVMRVGSMLRQLLNELREVQLDEGSRDRMRDIYDTSVKELGSALSQELRDELDRITIPFGTDEIPSEAELRVAQAQLVGWLEGLIQGIQATLFAQQMATQQQLAGMRSGGELLPGAPNGKSAIESSDDQQNRPGTYL
ncbi:MAG TPA: proteasome activator [Acidimicrobiales bacterium]|nr:proteasome activator [Acidimicrobiales bacterium]